MEVFFRLTTNVVVMRSIVLHSGEDTKVVAKFSHATYG